MCVCVCVVRARVTLAAARTTTTARLCCCCCCCCCCCAWALGHRGVETRGESADQRLNVGVSWRVWVRGLWVMGHEESGGGACAVCLGWVGDHWGERALWVHPWLAWLSWPAARKAQGGAPSPLPLRPLLFWPTCRPRRRNTIHAHTEKGMMGTETGDPRAHPRLTQHSVGHAKPRRTPPGCHPQPRRHYTLPLSQHVCVRDAGGRARSATTFHVLLGARSKIEGAEKPLVTRGISLE